MGGAASAAGSAIGSVGGVFGNGEKAGVLGQGQYEGTQYDVNKDAFYNDYETRRRQGQFAAQAAQRAGMAAPTMQAANIDQSQQAQFRQGQTGLVGDLQAQAAGQGPSLAQSQLQQATEGNIRSAMAMGSNHPGMNPALAQRQIMQSAAGANQQAAMQSAQTRAQEQMAARGQLAGVLQGARGQDIGLASSQADLNQQAAMNNQKSALEAQAQKDAMAKFSSQALMQGDQDIIASRQNYEKLKADQAAGMNQVNAQSYADTAKRRGNGIGQLGSGIAAIAGLSRGGMVPAYYAKGGMVKKPCYADGGEIGFGNALRNFDAGSGSLKASGFKIDTGAFEDHSLKKKDKKSGEAEDDLYAKGETSTVPDSTNSDMDSPAPNSMQLGDTSSGGLAAAEGGEVDDDKMLKADGFKLNSGGDEGGGPADSIAKLAPLAMLMAGKGGKVPGQAEVAGDSYANDKVPVVLSPGEIVLPRTVAAHAIKDPKSKTVQQFLEAVKKKHMAEGGAVEQDMVEDTTKTPVSDATKKFADAMRKSFGG